MKKNYLKSFCARCLTLLVLALLSTNLAWGAEKTDEISIKGFANGTSTSYVTSITEGESTSGITIKAQQFIPSTGQIKGNQTNAANQFLIYNTDPFPGAITKIEITATTDDSNYFKNKMYAAVGTESQAEVSSVDGLTAWDSNFTWSFNANGNYTYFKLLSNEKFTNGSVKEVKIKITYEESLTPAIEVDVEEIEFEQRELSETVTDSKVISATGKNLTAAISASMKSGSAAVFSVTPNGTPTAAAGEFTVSYSTTEAGEYAGTVVLSSGETSIEIPVSASVVEHIPVLQSIEVSGTPTKTEYKEGEEFDPAGLVVTGTYDVGEPQIITEGITWDVTPSGALPVGTTSVNVTATVDGIKSAAFVVNGLTVTEIPYIFYESFDTNEGTGGNDNQWSGQIALNTLTSDNEGWSFSNGGGADKCAKFGAGGKKGSAITPALGYAGNAVISFKAAAWDGNSEGTTLNISVVDGGTVSPSSVTLVKGAWSTYQVSLTNLTTDSKIKFEAENASNNRFFLDEIMIVRAGASKEVAISSAGWATVCLPFKATITSDNATAYYVTGTNETALTKEEASVIPAGEGILLKGKEGEKTTVTFTISDEDADPATDNMMKGAITETTFDESGYKYYILANGGNGLGFYYQGAENDGSTVTCAAGKAILAVPTTSSAKAFFSLDNEPTGITSYENENDNENLKAMTVYNLNGMKVNNSYKGIVIMNGKKYINK